MKILFRKCAYLLPRLNFACERDQILSLTKTVSEKTFRQNQVVHFTQRALQRPWRPSCISCSTSSPAFGTISKDDVYHRISAINTNASNRLMCTNQPQEPKEAIKIPDNIPKTHPEYGDLVYMPPLSGRVKMLKLFSLSTSGVGIAFQPYVWMQASKEIHSIIGKIALFSTVSGFLFLTPLLVQWMMKRYVLYAYFNKDTNKFTAVTYTLFLQKKYHTFTADEVDHGEGPSMVSNLTVNGHPMMVDPAFFFDVDHYAHLMGHDKPLEWILKMKDENQQAQK